LTSQLSSIVTSTEPRDELISVTEILYEQKPMPTQNSIPDTPKLEVSDKKESSVEESEERIQIGVYIDIYSLLKSGILFKAHLSLNYQRRDKLGTIEVALYNVDKLMIILILLITEIELLQQSFPKVAKLLDIGKQVS